MHTHTYFKLRQASLLGYTQEGDCLKCLMPTCFKQKFACLSLRAKSLGCFETTQWLMHDQWILPDGIVATPCMAADVHAMITQGNKQCYTNVYPRRHSATKCISASTVTSTRQQPVGQVKLRQTVDRETGCFPV